MNADIMCTEDSAGDALITIRLDAPYTGRRSLHDSARMALEIGRRWAKQLKGRVNVYSIGVVEISFDARECKDDGEDDILFTPLNPTITM